MQIGFRDFLITEYPIMDEATRGSNRASINSLPTETKAFVISQTFLQALYTFLQFPRRSYVQQKRVASASRVRDCSGKEKVQDKLLVYPGRLQE